MENMRIGNLTVLREDGRQGRNKTWVFRCDCGAEFSGVLSNQKRLPPEKQMCTQCRKTGGIRQSPPPTAPQTASPPAASPPTASPPTAPQTASPPAGPQTASPPAASPPTASPPTASPPTASPLDLKPQGQRVVLPDGSRATLTLPWQTCSFMKSRERDAIQAGLRGQPRERVHAILAGLTPWDRYCIFRNLSPSEPYDRIYMEIDRLDPRVIHIEATAIDPGGLELGPQHHHRAILDTPLQVPTRLAEDAAQAKGSVVLESSLSSSIPEVTKDNAQAIYDRLLTLSSRKAGELLAVLDPRHVFLILHDGAGRARPEYGALFSAMHLVLKERFTWKTGE